MKTEIKNIHINIMGTCSFDLKIRGMRKFQDFCIYPMQSGESSKLIIIQSDTRIGKINLETGKGIMSDSKQGGSYFHNLMFAKNDFQLESVDLQTLKLYIFTTQGSKVGKSVVFSDNSEAINVI